MFKQLAIVISALVLIGLILSPDESSAIPEFTHQFGIGCTKCHSVVPELNAFGRKFLQYGFHLPKISPNKDVLPIGLRVGLVNTSEPSMNGLPKNTVDELVLISGGEIGPRFSYYVHDHVIDSGLPGQIKQLYLTYFITPYDSRVPVRLSAGSYELPTWVSCEEFRPTVKTYDIFSQTEGSNPFTMCAPKIGPQLQAGDTTRGTSVALLALQGSEPQSGLQPDGTDTMFEIQHVSGPYTVAAYSYNGTRPDGAVQDGFHRYAVGLGYARGRWESYNMLQRGLDSSVNGAGMGGGFSGGFTQLRYAFSPRLFAAARYEGTSGTEDGSFSRQATLLLGYRPAVNYRLTAEDVISEGPTKNTLNIHLLFAY